MKFNSSLSCRLAAAWVLGLVLVAGCGKSNTGTVSPLEISSDSACSLDGMLLADFPGPKAQLLYEQGEPDFFCDTIEMFSIYLRPEQQRRVSGAFVQDMAKADWQNPVGYWTDARSAFYVAGSKRRGPMGPTLASFAQEADAQAFATQEGGKVYRFDQITSDMVVLDGGVVKDSVKGSRM